MPLAPSPNELLRARADARRLLPENVQIWRAAYTPDGKGGQTTSWTMHSEGPGRLAPMRGSEQEYYADKIGTVQGWVISVTPDRAVLADDQLRIGARTFEVVDTDYGATDSWLERIPCREIS